MNKYLKYGLLTVGGVVVVAAGGAAYIAATFNPNDYKAQIIKAVKVSSMVGINHVRGEAGELWQSRFYDHALRTVKEYHETVECVHLNPVRRGLVKRPEDWRWSSFPEYAGTTASKQVARF